MKEEWKPINGFDGKYEVSNLGRVKRFDKILKNSVQKLIRHKGSTPYERYRVNLWKNNKYKTYKVHRLVAETFIPNPENKPQVNHKDNNPLNNVISNLEWVTNKENIYYAMNQGRMNRGSNNGMSKIKENDVIEIRKNKDLSYEDKILLANKYTLFF